MLLVQFWHSRKQCQRPLSKEFLKNKPIFLLKGPHGGKKCLDVLWEYKNPPKLQNNESMYIRDLFLVEINIFYFTWRITNACYFLTFLTFSSLKEVKIFTTAAMKVCYYNLIFN